MKLAAKKIPVTDGRRKRLPIVGCRECGSCRRRGIAVNKIDKAALVYPAQQSMFGISQGQLVPAHVRHRRFRRSAQQCDIARQQMEAFNRSSRSFVRAREQKLHAEADAENRLRQPTQDIDEIFLNAVAKSYDPHSEYMGRSNLESFEISMRLSLVGIGAELRSEDGCAKVERLVPGGPAERSGKMSAGDRIVAIAQGEDLFVDSRDMKLDKIVELIRGKKGTVVRLQVLPAGAADPSKRSVVALVRDTVKLTEAEAKAEIIDKAVRNPR